MYGKKIKFLHIFLTIPILGIVFFLGSFFQLFFQGYFEGFYSKNDTIFLQQTFLSPDFSQKLQKEFSNFGGNIYQFYNYQNKTQKYLPYIEAELQKKGLPDDLKYLPIVESGLNIDAISKAGAVGIWQFMPETATQYGLIINESVDERYHFEKSTQAALQYLTFLYNKFEDWPLAIASYNRGQNAIQKALIEQKVENFFDLSLNEETSRYFFKIIVVKYILEKYNNFPYFIQKIISPGINTIPQYHSIQVGQIDNLSTWASQQGYNIEQIHEMNKWILGNSLPEGIWEIRVALR